MAPTPNIPRPDRIDPQAPPEAPSPVPSPEDPGQDPPEIAPLSPDTEQPGIRPGEWQPLDMALMPFVAWWNLLLAPWALLRAEAPRACGHHDLTIPDPIEASGEKALFA